MSDYIVSARKYRPDSFETLIGQDNIAKTLKNSILRSQLAHAYLFCGPRGVGKTSTARIFAKTINCANPSADMEPCGECESCRSFAEGRSYCIHELDAASNNGVEDIKTLMDQVQIPPQVGKYSVYIIDEVHMLSQSAFNAFLKTLEEPPAHAIFILATTEKHKILPTILSRCQTYDFNRISIMDMVTNLRSIALNEGVEIDDESLHIIAQKADGAMRDALTIFDQTVAFCGTSIKYEDVLNNLNVLDYEYSFRLVDAFLAGDYASALLVFDEVLVKGFNSLHFVSALSGHIRDLLVSKTAGLESLLDLPDSLKTRYRVQADRCSVKFLYDALEVATQCEIGYKSSTNQRLHIEFALMKMSFLMKSVPNLVPASAPVAARQDVLKASSGSNTMSDGSLKPEGVVNSVSAGSDKAIETGKVNEHNEVIDIMLDDVVEPVAKSAPVKKSVKGAAGLSMMSILNDVEEKEERVVIAGGELPSDEALNDAWKELALSYGSQPRLANALQKASVSFAEEGGVKVLTFTVVNEAQRNWIREKILKGMEERIRMMVDSSRIRLDVDVIPQNETVSQIYLPEEKAKVMMKENEELRNLVVDLGLDVK